MEEGDEKVDSLFPLFAVPSDAQQSLAPINNAPDTEWLSNSSFTTDLSVINVALASLYKDESPTAAAVASSSSPHQAKPEPTSYEILEGEKEGKHRSDSDNDVFGSDSNDRGRKKRRKKKRTEKHRRKRKRPGDVEEDDAAGGFTSRKSNVRAWADSDVKPPKDYYFDAHGDRDNLVYGSLYRMDIPRYRPFNSENQSAFDFRGLFGLTQRVSALDKDGDIDALDPKLRSAGRYWSPKYAAVERHRNLKRLRLAVPKRSRGLTSEDFIPLYDVEVPSVLEESWEDEVLRKTREFNKLTRENPLHEKAWLDFAGFQDRVISMQAHKGARLQMLEKKISILEKATELITDSEELLLSLMKAYKSRDNRDELIGRWERVLARHSGSHKLWKEFLRVVRGEFSRFKVSDVRKMYAHAIQALSAACRKQFRQASLSEKSSIHEPVIDDLELGLVDIFLSLCRFEWQAGYQELATALFQAEIEFSLFCPSLFLSENSKQRLFEHFWNSNGPRIGEEGAMGWCTWLEKEEENRQKIMKVEASCDDDRGGWTGWSEQPSRSKDMDKELKNVVDNDLTSGHFQEEVDSEEDIKQEDDVETLLKQLGIDVDVEEGTEVRDTLTWNKWCQEELLRDANQWMPIRKKPDASISETDKRHEGEDNEQFTRVILFEDVSEYMFSLSSREARLSLLSEFVEFFSGQITQRICTNSSSWTEKILSLEVLPDCILQNLRSVGDLANPQSSSTGNSLEFCLGSTIDSHRRLDVMKFVRNAILLCLTVFPRNPMLQEAAFAAEELSVTGTYSHTASRALAKSLLKCDRQDVLLCGVYARREAAFGNIDLARRVFDMALSSVEELSLDIQSNAPLLCFWYAEAECANSSGDAHESSSRALHILSCLGNGVKYVQFEHEPSNLQLLRAHQGFKERMKTIQSAWGHGMIDDQSIALACSAALFEELTAGCTASVEVLEDVFAMALPERRIKSGQLEFLFNYYVKMLLRNHEKLSGSRIWRSISQGLQMYPSSSELLKALVDISYLYTTPNKVRLIFDDYCHRNPSVTLWLAALSFEMSRGGSQHRIQALFERALTNETLNKSVIIWHMYIAYGTDVIRNPSTAKRIFFRAVHACPWSKKLWLDGFSKLNSLLTAKELSDLQEVMRDKELNLRTDIYEILLKDELVS